MQSYYVYIICDSSRKLRVGVTSDLVRSTPANRVEEPVQNADEGEGVKLLYFECFRQEDKALIRQRDIHAWREEKLLELVEFVNPEWFDLARYPADLQSTLNRFEKIID